MCLWGEFDSAPEPLSGIEGRYDRLCLHKVSIKALQRYKIEVEPMRQENKYIERWPSTFPLQT